MIKWDEFEPNCIIVMGNTIEVSLKLYPIHNSLMPTVYMMKKKKLMYRLINSYGKLKKIVVTFRVILMV